jgi:hypothetical protein
VTINLKMLQLVGQVLMMFGMEACDYKNCLFYDWLSFIHTSFVLTFWTHARLCSGIKSTFRVGLLINVSDGLLLHCRNNVVIRGIPMI